MFAFLTDSALGQQLSDRYYQLEPRDQLALKILSAFLGIILLYSFVVQPAREYQLEAEQHYRQSLEALNWIEANKPLVTVAANQRAKRDPGQSLLGIANATSKSYRLSFNRYQPVGENGLSLWLNKVAFNDVVLWLERLDKRYGISVKEIAVEREANKGLVNVRLVLQG